MCSVTLYGAMVPKQQIDASPKTLDRFTDQVLPDHTQAITLNIDGAICGIRLHVHPSETSRKIDAHVPNIVNYQVDVADQPATPETFEDRIHLYGHDE